MSPRLVLNVLLRLIYQSLSLYLSLSLCQTDRQRERQTERETSKLSFFNFYSTNFSSKTKADWDRKQESPLSPDFNFNCNIAVTKIKKSPEIRNQTNNLFVHNNYCTVAFAYVTCRINSI